MGNLVLHKLNLENFIQFNGKHEFIFEPGLTGLIGQNGSGKSTILNAIFFTLFGENIHDSLKDMLNNKISDSDRKDNPCVASLVFSTDSLKHRITRQINKTGSMTTKLEIFSDEYSGNLYSKKKNEVDKYIQDLLKVEFPMCETSIFSPQDKSDLFFELSNQEAKDLLDSFLQARYEERSDNLKNRTKLLKNRLSRIELLGKNIKENKNSLNSDKNTLSEKISSLEEFLEKTNIEKVNSEKSELESEKESLSAKVGSIQEISKSIELLKDRSNTLETYISNLEMNLSTSRKRIEDTTKLQGENNKDLDELRNKSKTLPKLQSVDKSVLEEYKNKVIEVTKEIDDIKSKIQSVTANKLSKEKQLQEIKNKGKELKQAKENSKCPTCGTDGIKEDTFDSKLEDLRTEYSHIETIIKELNTDLKILDKSLLEKKTVLDECQEKLTELEEKFFQYKDRHSERLQLASNLKYKYKSVKELFKKLKELQESLEYNQDLESKEKPKWESEKSKIDQDIVEKESQIKDKESLLNKIKSLEGDIDEKNKIIDDYKSTESTIKIHKENMEDIKKKISKTDRRLKKCAEVYKYLSTKVKEYEFIKKIFDSSYNEYFSEALRIISELTNELLGELNSNLQIELKYENKGSRNILQRKIFKNSLPVSFKLSSGGQMTMVGICFRVALWRFINTAIRSPLSLLVLDEVFGSLDKDSSSYMFNKIAQLKKHFDYIIMTSHTDHIWNTDRKVLL